MQRPIEESRKERLACDNSPPTLSTPAWRMLPPTWSKEAKLSPGLRLQFSSLPAKEKIHGCAKPLDFCGHVITCRLTTEMAWARQLTAFSYPFPNQRLQSWEQHCAWQEAGHEASTLSWSLVSSPTQWDPEPSRTQRACTKARAHIWTSRAVQTSDRNLCTDKTD